jgi:hypothetical protein
VAHPPVATIRTTEPARQVHSSTSFPRKNDGLRPPRGVKILLSHADRQELAIVFKDFGTFCQN